MRVESGASVWYGAVLRADFGPIVIRAGATIGDEALIGNHATVLDGARIGDRSLVAAGSLVTGGTEIPDEVLVTGSPAKVKGPIAGTAAEFWVATNPHTYRDLAQRHRVGIAELSS